VLKGLETLTLRAHRQSENALKVGHFLEGRVPRINFPALPSHPQHELAMRQMDACGPIFSFEVEGREQAFAVLNALELIDISNNIGDARSLMCHNASTTHYSVSAEAREEMGVSEGMLRLNVGLEDPQDVIDDLDQALARAGFGDGERETALARLRELGYINDPETARMRAQTRVGLGEAPRLTRKRLEAQGIEADVARKAAAEAADGAGEDALVAKALQRRLRGRKPADMREKQRLVRALAAKGHRPSAVARALGLDWEGDDDCDDP